MNELMEAIYKAALEQVVALLNHPDPQVRLETSLGILQTFEASVLGIDQDLADRVSDLENIDYNDNGQDRDDHAEVGEDFEPPSAEEVAAELERKAAEQQALAEQRTPPAAERAGRSAIGSGEQRP